MASLSLFWSAWGSICRATMAVKLEILRFMLCIFISSLLLLNMRRDVDSKLFLLRASAVCIGFPTALLEYEFEDN